MTQAQMAMARSNLLSNRKWSDGYMPAVIQILAPLLISTSTPSVDCKEAVDLVVSAPRIAVRLRRPGYALKYPHQFTLRLQSTAHHHRCEWDKILEGRVDWLFYGHLGGDGGISHWMIIDLHLLIAAFVRGLAPHEDCRNPDSGSFRSFDATKLPGNCLLAMEPAAPWA